MVCPLMQRWLRRFQPQKKVIAEIMGEQYYMSVESGWGLVKRDDGSDMLAIPSYRTLH